MPTLTSARRTVAAAAIALGATFGLASTALAAAPAAAPVAVTYDVQASAAGQTGTFTITPQVTASAPAAVAPGGALTVSVSVGSITVPTSADGQTVTQLQGIALKVPVPKDSTYVSAKLSGGSGIGTGKPTVSQSKGIVTIKVPGPIKAGTTFTLPTLALHLKAGTSGTISTKLYGTSYTTPGLTFTAVLSVIGLPVDAAAVGYPSPNPTLTTTKIS